MQKNQAKNSFILIISNSIVKGSNFAKQLLMAFLLGLSAEVDILLAAQVVPTLITALISAGAGEIIISRIKNEDELKDVLPFYLISLLCLTILFGVLYFAFLPIFSTLLGLDSSRSELFLILSIIYLLNLVPKVFVTGLRPTLYYMGEYKFYTISATFSEILTLLMILAATPSFGIVGFAFGTLVGSFINAFLYIYRSKINFNFLFLSDKFNAIKNDLRAMLKKASSVSLNTLLKNGAQIVERTLAVKFLSAGYLSALNYSKSISELPSSIFLDSIVTTTYIEQSKIYSKDKIEFNRYSLKMLMLFTNFSALLQILSIILAPFLLIIIYKRGRFDSAAVQETLTIYQILQLGFVTHLLFGFLIRSLFIFNEYKNILIFSTAKILLQVLLLGLFIDKIQHILPLAYIISEFLIVFLMLRIFAKHIYEKNLLLKIWIKIFVIIISGLPVIYFNWSNISYILTLNLMNLISIYILPLIMTLILLLYFLKENDLIDISKIKAKLSKFRLYNKKI